MNTYKTVCDKCRKKTWYETEQQCHAEYPAAKTCKTCGHTEIIEPIKIVRCTGTLRVIDNAGLDERFTPYYENNKRVEVLYKDGATERFNIGKSTGWKPVYIMLKCKNSHGGEVILSDLIVKIKSIN